MKEIIFIFFERRNMREWDLFYWIKKGFIVSRFFFKEFYFEDLICLLISDMYKGTNLSNNLKQIIIKK